MKKIFLIFMSAVMLMLCGCEEKKDSEKTLNEPDSMYIEGPCIVLEDGQYMIVKDENNPIVMSCADKSVFDNLTTGDIIKIECKVIMETYPAKTTILDLEFIKDGKPEDISQDLLTNLEGMGWVAVK